MIGDMTMKMKTILLTGASAILSFGCSEVGAQSKGGDDGGARALTHSTSSGAAESIGYITKNPGPGKITPEILNSVALGGSGLRNAQISPDGSFVTVLQSGSDGLLGLWAYDLESGEGRPFVSASDLLEEPEVLSAEEKNRRERARETGRGIISYSWVGDDLLMFPLGGDLYTYNLSLIHI